MSHKKAKKMILAPQNSYKNTSKESVGVSSSNSFHSKPLSKSKNLLAGTVCYVETINSDGTNASDGHIRTLKSLGATISDTFGDNLTHYICCHGESKRAKAAALLGVHVVSPLWIEQCNESCSMANEEDFSIVTSLKENIAPSLKEPRKREVLNQRNVDSPFFSSSQWESEKLESKVKKPVTRQSNGKFAKSRVTSTMKVNNNSNNSNSNTAIKAKGSSPGEHSIISSDEDEPLPKPIAIKSTNLLTQVIPLPSFKPYIPPPNPNNSATKRRRSERISDTYDADPEDDENQFREVNDDSLKNINPNHPLLVIHDHIPSTTITSNHMKSNSNIKSKSKSKGFDISSKNKATVSSNKNLNTSNHQLHSKDIKETNNSVVLSISGFDDGERATLSALIAALIKMFSDNNTFSSSSSSSSLSNSTGVSPVPPVIGSAGRLLANDEDACCESITCLIASESSRRTQRMLFAMARGIPIVTPSWLYSCLEAGKWVDIKDFIHPYDANKKDLTKLFKGETFLVGASADPEPKLLVALLQLCGAKITEDITKASSLLFGDSVDADAWYASLGPTLTSHSKIKAMKLGQDSKAFSKKYLFDCIEAGRKIDVIRRSSSLITDSSIKLLITFSEKTKKSIKKMESLKRISSESTNSSKSIDSIQTTPPSKKQRLEAAKCLKQRHNESKEDNNENYDDEIPTSPLENIIPRRSPRVQEKESPNMKTDNLNANSTKKWIKPSLLSSSSRLQKSRKVYNHQSDDDNDVSDLIAAAGTIASRLQNNNNNNSNNKSIPTLSQNTAASAFVHLSRTPLNSISITPTQSILGKRSYSASNSVSNSITTTSKTKASASTSKNEVSASKTNHGSITQYGKLSRVSNVSSCKSNSYSSKSTIDSSNYNRSGDEIIEKSNHKRVGRFSRLTVNTKRSVSYDEDDDEEIDDDGEQEEEQEEEFDSDDADTIRSSSTSPSGRVGRAESPSW